MKKFLAVIAIASLMASCTDSSTSEGSNADTSATPMQSAPLDTTATTTDTSALRTDTTQKADSPAVR